MCLLYGVNLRVGCVECYTATEGCVCVFYWKTTDLVCLNRLNSALDEWHSEAGLKWRNRMKIIKYFTVAAFIISNACAVNAADKTEKLSKSELEKVLINHTYPLGGKTLKKSKGAMYFTDNGKLEIVWEGAKGKGKWKADNKSRFCYTQSLWGGRECITLLRNNEDGGFVHIFDGEKRMLVEGAIEKGRKL